MEKTNTLRIMTNNCWNRDTNSEYWEKIGEDCSAPVRSAGLSELYLTYSPDIICFQEMTPLMMELIREKMAVKGLIYDLIAREPKDFTSILYNPYSLKLIENGSHLFDYGNDARSKGYTWGYFEHIFTGRKFFAVSTHWWWKSDSQEEGSSELRRRQAAELVSFSADMVKKYNCPIFVLGDFNTETNSPAYHEIINGGFEDCQKTAISADNTSGYHTCTPKTFNEELLPGSYEECSIDHITVLNRQNTDILSFRQPVHDYYWKLSDHIPVFIDIAFTERQSL